MFISDGSSVEAGSVLIQQSNDKNNVILFTMAIGILLLLVFSVGTTVLSLALFVTNRTARPAPSSAEPKSKAKGKGNKVETESEIEGEDNAGFAPDEETDGVSRRSLDASSSAADDDVERASPDSSHTKF